MHYFTNTKRANCTARAAGYQVSYHYDGAGRLLNRILSNGTQTDYKYDNDNRLIRLKNLSANKTEVENLNYQRDNIGNITQISNTTNGKITAYTYDARYQLTNVNSTTNSEDRTYTYDKVGNRKTMLDNGITYYYNHSNGNRLTDIRTGATNGPLYRQFSYDDAGRVKSKRDGNNAIIYLLNYTGKGQTYASFSLIAGATVYAYDANDYRIKKGNKLYHLEGKNLEATYDSTGVLQDKYLRGVIVDEIVNGYYYNSNNKNDWVNTTYHHDHLNSITAQTGPNGTVEETTRYDAFGKPSLTLMGTGNDLLYTGREYDTETGLYYYRARYYDPEIGRFLSEDPLGFKAGVNFYAYVNNNPINFNDPNGNCPNCLTAFLGGAIGGVIGFGVEGAGQLLTGKFDGSRLIGSTLGGAVTGGIIGFTGGTSLLVVGGASALGGATGNLAKQGSGNLLGEQQGFNTGEFVQETAFSAFAGPIGSKIKIPFSGVTSGRNSFSAITKSTFTKLNNGTIQRVSGTTIGKAVFAETISSLPEQAIKGGVNFLSNAANDPSFNSGVAGGGFVLYPSKPNTNTLKSVYSK